MVRSRFSEAGFESELHSECDLGNVVSSSLACSRACSLDELQVSDVLVSLSTG